MSSTRHPPAYCLETMEDTPKGNGVVRDSRFRRFNLCQTRNLAILFLFVIVLIIAAVLSAGTDVFESRDVSLPATNNGKGGDELVDSLNNGGNDDGDKGDNADDIDDMINKVNLDSFNPKRDGVDFISPICNYTCQTDRLPHETPLYPGQVLCNEMHRFGMTEEGEFFLQNCQLTDQNDGKLTVFWSAKEAQLAPDQYPIHFEMEKNGYFQIISDPSGQVLFEKRPTRNVTFHRLCLNNRPKLHCPYLHLHNDAVVVLNWIDDVQGRWMARNVKHEYVELFPEDIGDEGADDNAGADDTTNDEDDVDDMINKVHLDAFNPKRDGVEFISPICNYTCQTDRLPHETPLYPGQVLCNQMHRFGMTDQGEFFVQNCQLTDQNDGKLTVFWSAAVV
ncbi:unnamed protein product [Cylindrotheca closterium]|uniref:Uncharacterized protein n=1 Tax=Cylindrotheca closterium TaxID=2856 RepID=A0AAD2G3D7_9STRA|nr:unnamed protein product [Cylindrotheca closterium]